MSEIQTVSYAIFLQMTAPDVPIVHHSTQRPSLGAAYTCELECGSLVQSACTVMERENSELGAVTSTDAAAQLAAPASTAFIATTTTGARNVDLSPNYLFRSVARRTSTVDGVVGGI